MLFLDKLFSVNLYQCVINNILYIDILFNEYNNVYFQLFYVNEIQKVGQEVFERFNFFI